MLMSLVLAVLPGWKLLRSLGGVGLVILGIIDSSVVPTFGSLDALTAILAAQSHELWPYYAAASTVGSLIGAYITYRMSAKAGEGWLEKRIGAKRSGQVQSLLKQRGFVAVFVACIAPPPFPTSAFFVGAGALKYPQGRFAFAVLTGRALRYALIGFLAAKYGRTIIRLLRHPRGPQVEAMWIGAAVAGAAIAVLFVLFWRQLKPSLPRAKRESGD
jgi:membrane protein YqaA with SNARE-associated domain